MARRARAATQAEEEDWLTTYADAITLLMASYVMLVFFSKIDLPAFEEAMAGIKKELGKEEAPKRPMFKLQENLDAILEEVQIDQDQVETEFDETGVVIEFESGSFFRPGSADLLPVAEKILLEIACELSQSPYDLYFVDVEGAHRRRADQHAPFPVELGIVDSACDGCRSVPDQRGCPTGTPQSRWLCRCATEISQPGTVR